MDIILLIVSIFVYISFGIQNLFYITFSLLTTYAIALQMNKKNKKYLLILGISINVVLLLFFKTVGIFSSKTFLMPLGMSYYTLQVVGYLIDVYRGKKPEQNILKYSLFIFYFPCLFLGPINRYEDLREILFKKRKITKENIGNGLLRISFGLWKKFVIAGRASILITTITTKGYNGFYSLFALLCYSVLLYTDFSGGVDIVLGVSKIIGIPLKENFDRPYFSLSIKEFWRRWHMSLSSWLKDYIYIPLGGSRVSKTRHKWNLILTFFISGLWHGTNYLLWGILHGICVSFSDKIKIKWKSVNWLLTFSIVTILWVFFLYPDTLSSLKAVGSIITNWNIGEFLKNIFELGLSPINYIIWIVSIFFLFLFEKYQEQIILKLKKWSLEKKIILTGSILLMVLILGIYGIGFQMEEFIYSKF